MKYATAGPGDAGIGRHNTAVWKCNDAVALDNFLTKTVGKSDLLSATFYRNFK